MQAFTQEPFKKAFYAEVHAGAAVPTTKFVRNETINIPELGQHIDYSVTVKTGPMGGLNFGYKHKKWLSWEAALYYINDPIDVDSLRNQFLHSQLNPLIKNLDISEKQFDSYTITVGPVFYAHYKRFDIGSKLAAGTSYLRSPHIDITVSGGDPNFGLPIKDYNIQSEKAARFNFTSSLDLFLKYHINRQFAVKAAASLFASFTTFKNVKTTVYEDGKPPQTQVQDIDVPFSVVNFSLGLAYTF